MSPLDRMFGPSIQLRLYGESVHGQGPAKTPRRKDAPGAPLTCQPPADLLPGAGNIGRGLQCNPNSHASFRS
jgi:hypothetical protein